MLDTNVPVSATLSANGNESTVVGLGRDGRIAVCVSQSLIDGYVEVLTRTKFRFSQARLDVLFDFLRSGTALVEPATQSPASPNPSDTKFIACAIAARADFIVTGNRRHFPEPSYGTAAVGNARELLDRIG